MKTTTNSKATETKCYCAECDRAGGSSPFCPRKMTAADRAALYADPMGKGRETQGRIPRALEK